MLPLALDVRDRTWYDGHRTMARHFVEDPGVDNFLRRGSVDEPGINLSVIAQDAFLNHTYSGTLFSSVHN